MKPHNLMCYADYVRFVEIRSRVYQGGFNGNGTVPLNLKSLHPLRGNAGSNNSNPDQKTVMCGTGARHNCFHHHRGMDLISAAVIMYKVGVCIDTNYSCASTYSSIMF